MLQLTNENWTLLNDVNKEVNALTIFTHDITKWFKEDFWTVMKQQDDGMFHGDCDDYSLTKRFKLIQAGIDYTNLRPALCWTEGMEFHCVLTVETDSGVYILDNRYYDVTPWRNLPYTWHSRQVPGKYKWDIIVNA